MPYSVTDLINAIIEKKNQISYINLDENHRYLGWTHDFGLTFPDHSTMRLDLHNESERFLLFVLASAWSRTGRWENATYFVSYLKEKNKHRIDKWRDESFVESERNNSEEAANYAAAAYHGIDHRVKVSFRKDIYDSCRILANNWRTIEEHLRRSERENNYMIFIDYISELKGLGAGDKRMKIKIPLILRELRCQGIYKNIPGEYCCVPDVRAIDTAKAIGIPGLRSNTIKAMMKSSAIIYRHFGDLYDIPLFAYEDVMNASRISNEKANDIQKLIKTNAASTIEQQCGFRMIMPLSGRGKEIRYRIVPAGYDVVWGEAKFMINIEIVDQLMNDFFSDNEWEKLGASMTRPIPGGMGEYISSLKYQLTPRHASAIAAILVEEGYLIDQGAKPICLKKAEK